MISMPCVQVTTSPATYQSGQPCPSVGPFSSGGFATEAQCREACKEGACCESNGTCNVRPQCQCQGAGQTFRGVGTTCTPNPCGCACVGPPYFDTPGSGAFRGSTPFIQPITVRIDSGPSEIQGTYTLTFIYPSTSGDYQANGYRWNYAANISGGAMSINVRFGPTIVECPANGINCDTQAYVRVFAFGNGFSFSGISGTPQQSTLAGCTLPCGNVTTDYAVSHSGFASGSAPSDRNLIVTLPTNYTNPLP